MVSFICQKERAAPRGKKEARSLMPRGQRVLSGLMSHATTTADDALARNAAACKSLQSVLLHHCGAPAEEQEQEPVGTCSELMELYTRQCASHHREQAPAAKTAVDAFFLSVW